MILPGNLSRSGYARLAQGLYLAWLAGWIFLQIFALPFLFEQRQPSLRLVWRNGAALVGCNPGDLGNLFHDRGHVFKPISPRDEERP